jgi:hypothetical protein
VTVLKLIGVIALWAVLMALANLVLPPLQETPGMADFLGVAVAVIFAVISARVFFPKRTAIAAPTSPDR